MTDREKIAARIRALLAKTVENGCTEDEAVAAAAKAAEMLERYNLSIDEVQMRETPLKRHAETFTDMVGDRLWRVAAAISHLTGARYWCSPAGVRPVRIDFLGFHHEVEVAQYLLDICGRAMRQKERELDAAWGLLRPAAKRRKVIPYLDGMASRLAQRIRALKPTATGKGLIVVRDQIIAQEMDRLGIKTKDRQTRKDRDFEDTYLGGVRAADQVALNRGVEARRRDTLRLR